MSLTSTLSIVDNDDASITLALRRFDAASEKKRHHQKEISFHQKELEKAQLEIEQARKELQSEGSAAVDSLLILSNDNLRAVFPFCDWLSLLKLEMTCKRIYQLTPPEWKSRDQMIDKSSKWLALNDHDDESDVEHNNDLCRLRTVRYERAAAFAKRLEPMVHRHTHNAIAEHKCRGCSDFPSQTNIECFRENLRHGYFLRIFSQLLPGDDAQNNNNNNAQPNNSHNHNAVDEDKSLLWQGVVDIKEITNYRNDSEVSFQMPTGFDFNKVWPHLKEYFWCSHYRHEHEWGNLSQEEQQMYLKDSEEIYEVFQKAVGNVGFILVALNPSNERLSLVHATAETNYADEQLNNICFKHMKQEIHSSSEEDDHVTSLELSMDDQMKNLCMKLYYQGEL